MSKTRKSAVVVFAAIGVAAAIFCMRRYFFVDKTDPDEYQKVCEEYFGQIWRDTHPSWTVEEKTRAAVFDFEKLGRGERKKEYDEKKKKLRD